MSTKGIDGGMGKFKGKYGSKEDGVCEVDGEYGRRGETKEIGKIIRWRGRRQT